jgi:hypothetical protein
MHMGLEARQGKKIRAASFDAALIQAIYLPSGSYRANSTRHLLYTRAELHRRVRNFLATSSEGNGSDDCCENDSAFHSLLRWSLTSQDA